MHDDPYHCTISRQRTEKPRNAEEYIALKKAKSAKQRHIKTKHK